jgi:hypothetical protein
LKIKSLTSYATVLFLLFIPEVSANDSNKEVLSLISSFANDFCKEIPLQGNESKMELAGRGKIGVNKLLKQLADLNVEGMAKYSENEYNGILQGQLVDALKDSTRCRLIIWQDLKKMLSTPKIKSDLKEVSTQRIHKNWLEKLQSSEMIPSKGLAGLKIGDRDGLIEEVLGEPSRGYLPYKHSPAPAEHYAVHYRQDTIFFGVYAHRDLRKILSFRLYDTSFSQNAVFPNYKGITIGTPEKKIVSTLGKPRKISTDKESFCAMDTGSATATTTRYTYDGISFEVCSNNKQIWLLDVNGVGAGFYELSA